MGKSLCVLALISLTADGAERWAQTKPMSTLLKSARTGGRSRATLAVVPSMRKDCVGHSTEKKTRRLTFLVIMMSWIEQLEK